MITCLLPVIGQDSIAVTQPERHQFNPVNINKPKTVKLGPLPGKIIPSDQIDIIDPKKIQLKNLEKQVFESPESKAIHFIEASISWNKSLPIDFHKFNDRSKLNLSKFDSDQGLASDMIRDMAQDQNGNWWFATTANGIILYDGTSQRIFKKENGLSSNLIHVLLFDHLGQLWIGGEQGIDIFDGHQMKHLNTSNGLPNNSIWAMHLNNKNQIWIGTKKGLVRVNSAQDKIQFFSTDQGLPDPTVWSIHQDSRNQIWVATESGLAIIEETSSDNYELTTVQQKNGLPTDNIWTINEDNQGNIWMGSNGYGIYQWSPGDNEVRMFNRDLGLSSDWIWDVSPIDNGIWFGTYGNGAIYYEEKEGKATFTQLDTDNGVSNNYVLKVATDEQGDIWMATDGGGINVLHEPQGVIKHYNESTGLNEKFVQCVFRDSEGLLWMGTDSRGVNIINEAGEKVNYLSENQGLSYNSIWAILEDAQSRIWIGTENGLNVFDKTNNVLTKYDTLSGLSGNTPWTLYRDREDNIWVGTEDGGLCKYDPRTTQFVHFTDQGLNNTAIMGITQDLEGNIWVGTRGLGLAKISPNERIDIFNRQNGLSSDSITYVYVDSKNQVWAATEGHGISYFEPGNPTPSFQNLTKKEGLSNDEVWSVIEDNLGRIWVGTVDKITILSFEEDQFQVQGYVSTEQGLKSNDLNSSSVFKEKNGNLIWATIKGPSTINPSQIRPNSTSHQVLITGIEIEHQYVDFRKDKELEIRGSTVRIDQELELAPFSNVPLSLNLPHEVADIHVNFTAKKTYFKKDLKSQYRLLPSNKTWQNTETPTQVILNNLGPGNYILELRIGSSNGQWGQPTNFEFKIETPWWDTWVARGIGILIFLVALYTFYVVRTRSLIKSKEFLEKKVKERTYELERSLRDVVEARNQLVHSERMASLGMLSSGIAHELSNPISAVYNASQLIERDFDDILSQNGNEQEARDNIKMSMEVLKVASNQTREIIRGLTNYSRLESKEMILGDVHQCLDNSIMMIQSKLGDIQIEKNFDPDVPLVRCYYTELTQVFLNLISNAIDAIQDKAEKDGKIVINTSVEKRFVKITVADNGIGMSLETSQSIFKNFYTSKEPGRGTGLGLAISQSIIKKHHATISFETEKGKGTTFITLLPIEVD